MNTLIFDIAITGHHTEYISHLVDYLFENKEGNTYFFIVNPNFSEQFPAISFKASQVENITWVEITQKEYCISQKGNLIKKSFSNYKLMSKYAKLYNVQHAVLMYFNTFQLATVFFRPSYTLSGILFLQFYRMSRNSFKARLKYFRKFLTTRLYTLNPKIKSVFILNDSKTVSYLNKKLHTKIFKMLSDPIAIIEPLDNFDIYAHYNIEKNRKIFLHIGGLGERKGTFEVVESSLYIPSETQSEVVILLVGKINSNKEKDIILNKIEKSISKSNTQIIWDNQFVTNELMKSLFDQCHAVLMPYKNTEASSGILGHAAASNKPVIATGKGLLKELIEKYNLGLLVSDVEAKLLADKIVESFEFRFKDKKTTNFVTSHSANIFSEKIIGF